MPNKLVIESIFQIFPDLESLPESDRQLIDSAVDSAGNAYAPYSGFQVGAAVRNGQGKVIIGNNQENAAFPSGLCAERVALFSAFAQFPDDEIDTLAIVANTGEGNKPAMPCGNCRQTILEYEVRQNKPLRIIMSYNKGSFLVANSIKDLLPLGFTGENL